MSLFRRCKKNIFDRINLIPGGIKDRLCNGNPDLTLNLLGKCHDTISIEDMTKVWLISGEAISYIYRIVLKLREERVNHM